jgi:hypothetical protein
MLMFQSTAAAILILSFINTAHAHCVAGTGRRRIRLCLFWRMG